MASSSPMDGSLENVETCEEEPHETKKYEGTIAPKEGRWDKHNSSDFLSEYGGFWYPYFFVESVKSLQEHFKALPTDVFICSFPKSGTAWLKALCFSIATRKRFDESTNPLLTAMPHDCVPFLEVDLVDDSFSRDPELPLLSTHIPYNSLPKSMVAADSKIIYICRDPKDTFVSIWHFLLGALGKDEKGVGVETFSFEEEFKLFCQGKSAYGPFWEHILGYWKASLERPEKILFLKYEDMKRNTLFYIQKLAQFLDEPFSEEEEIKGVPQKIMETCSIGNLTSLEVNKSGKHRPDTPFAIDNSLYFRKGQVGDWKNHLTEQMKEQMDSLTQDKLCSFGLTFDTLSSP